MGPIEEPFGYSKQQRHPQAPLLSTSYPLPWQSFTLAGGHRSSQWPSYPSTPATCPGNGHPPAATTRLLHRLHPTEENKHTPTNKPYTAGGGGYTLPPPRLHGIYTTQARCVHRELPCAQRLFLVPRKSSTTTVPPNDRCVVPLRPDPASLPTAIDHHPSLFLSVCHGSGNGAAHLDSIQLGVERRRKRSYDDLSFKRTFKRSISVSRSDDFKLGELY